MTAALITRIIHTLRRVRETRRPFVKLTSTQTGGVSSNPRKRSVVTTAMFVWRAETRGCRRRVIVFAEIRGECLRAYAENDVVTSVPHADFAPVDPCARRVRIRAPAYRNIIITRGRLGDAVTTGRDEPIIRSRADAVTRTSTGPSTCQKIRLRWYLGFFFGRDSRANRV